MSHKNILKTNLKVNLKKVKKKKKSKSKLCSSGNLTGHSFHMVNILQNKIKNAVPQGSVCGSVCGCFIARKQGGVFVWVYNTVYYNNHSDTSCDKNLYSEEVEILLQYNKDQGVISVQQKFSDITFLNVSVFQFVVFFT